MNFSLFQNSRNLWHSREKAGSDPWDFTSSATNITFNGGSESGTLPAGGTLVSDEIDFTFDGNTDYLVAIYSTDGDMGYLDMSNAAYRRDGLGADDSMTVDPAMAYESEPYIEWLAKIEVYTGSGSGGGEKYFYHADYLGSVRLVTDVTGAVVWSERYRPFGMEEEQSGSIVNDYRFTGKAWDAEAGLFYFNARWYDPDTGRFISEDPLWGNILDPQSLNRFRYARNNPFRFNDPTGLYDDQDNYDDTELFGNAPDSPTRSEDGEGMGLYEPKLIGAARDAEHGNPIPFIEALKEILEKYLGKRNPADKYSFLPIARNWKDIPESVRNYKTGDKIQDTISGLGLHKDNKRFAGGYHIATEKNIQGVWMHYDAYDPMRSTTDFILHNTVEVYKTFLLPETYYP